MFGGDNSSLSEYLLLCCVKCLGNFSGQSTTSHEGASGCGLEVNTLTIGRGTVTEVCAQPINLLIKNFSSFV